MNFILKILRMFQPKIIRALQAELDKRQDADINAIEKVAAKFDHGLSGEQLDDMMIKLHDCVEVIVINRVNQLLTKGK